MTSKLSRRDFLKISATTLAGAAFTPFLPPRPEFSDGVLIRVASNGVDEKGIPVYTEPNDKSRIVRSVFRDDVLNVYEEVNSGTPGYNPIWYRVWGGYVHRARMQKVQYSESPIVQSIRKNGQLAEISVPYTQALRQIGNGSWQPLNRLYYSSVHWVKAVETGPDGKPWYSVLDELLDITYNVPANHLRLIPDEEIAPITPEVPFEKKHIEVSLATQRLVCYEYDQAVFSTLVSSGRINNNPGPNGIPTTTPSGAFRINVKMPSKHMGSGDLAQAADIGAYQLPGVPWTTFIQFQGRAFQGHAFHGTYWHDNFGVPMSSGCLNMRTEEAKWLFRWCLPSAPADQIDPLTLDKKGYGTPGFITP